MGLGLAGRRLVEVVRHREGLRVAEETADRGPEARSFRLLLRLSRLLLAILVRPVLDEFPLDTKAVRELCEDEGERDGLPRGEALGIPRLPTREAACDLRIDLVAVLLARTPVLLREGDATVEQPLLVLLAESASALRREGDGREAVQELREDDAVDLGSVREVRSRELVGVGEFEIVHAADVAAEDEEIHAVDLLASGIPMGGLDLERSGEGGDLSAPLFTDHLDLLLPTADVHVLVLAAREGVLVVGLEDLGEVDFVLRSHCRFLRAGDIRCPRWSVGRASTSHNM